MGTRSKDRIRAMITKDISDIYARCTEVKKSINDNLEDTLDYFHALLAQIPQSTSGPLITKTPKISKKRGVQRIETIPEDDIINIDNTLSDTIAADIKVEHKGSMDKTRKDSAGETTLGRLQRKASKKAVDNMRKQQSISLGLKRWKSSDYDDGSKKVKKQRGSQTKRKNSARSSSDEDKAQRPAKHSKTEGSILRGSNAKKTLDTNSEYDVSMQSNITHQETNDTSKYSSTRTQSSSRKRTLSQDPNLSTKASKVIDDTVIAPKNDELEEPSMYEDAIEKPTPIMNSTMNLNSTLATHKIMNATVVLEPLSAIKLNETVTINKKLDNSLGKDDESKAAQARPKSPRASSRSLQDRMQQLKETMVNKEFDELITEDESSPEIIKPRQNRKRQKQGVKKSLVLSEDEILNTPAKPTLKQMNAVAKLQEIRNGHKSNALFSPYAKESVKKRVEAFEQVGMNSPKAAVEADVPTRITRTKTRAIAAAQAETSEIAKNTEKTVAHKLARKSLAKAKKISLAKHAKENDESKENKVQAIPKYNRAVVTLEKMQQKQQKTTPLGRSKIQLPVPVNRIPHTPSNNYINPNQTKALSAARGNIITSMESFLQPTKSVNKRNSIERLEEKKRKMNDEDLKKKREDALKQAMEEKRRKRQEKELKNKLAREAKEKQELEKRQKAEREREERARLAQQMQEKQREEMEKKRMAQLQRAQEKEEKRRQEEHLRLQRLQEQEEAERLLAEQRRREQEAEKRREAETRAQQQAAAESSRLKNQLLAAQAKHGMKHHGPTNYILDSEPDDEESDDESRPKHVIPHWAQPQVRKAQLAIQRYIPEKAVFRFFDTRKCTPDLTQLFQGIDRSRLKRTSSAIWKTPPRYSMMDAD
ncbi:inner centromere protein isoform X1 [Andrena cerasifolii]|uniref:inner centromere protein isoform X1 n=1 Tax=Andrena cerasifolii TaxID=2819439 RepID=UPI004037DE54